MLPADLRASVNEMLSSKYGNHVEISSFSLVGGGCINQTGRLKTTAGDFFIKWNDAHSFPGMFEKEAKGLALLASTNTVYIPKVIGVGEGQQSAFLLMEYVEPARRCTVFWENFGQSLAEMHRNSQAQFGLDHSNYMGSLPQDNSFTDDWATFFIERRLEPQLKLAIDCGLLNTKHRKAFERLYKKLPGIFPKEKPALIHGDLWSGNFVTGNDGYACILDPAVYYGHREAELAMTKLFGGFDSSFYHAYANASPPEPGFEKRVGIYNLYPLLIHVNLFGGGYVGDVENVLNHFGQ